MKRSLSIFLAVMLISCLFAQETKVNDYPHTLQEFYEKLDEAFPDNTEITSMSYHNWRSFKSSPYWKLILNWVDTKGNPVFLQNINPNGYKIDEGSCSYILCECYWSYKNGIEYDLDSHFREQEAIDFPKFPSYPHTLQDFYEKLDAEFSDCTDITAMSLEEFFNKYSFSRLRRCISYWLNYKENDLFFQNINPKRYRVHKETYPALLMECYWSYKNGIDYDLELHFECDDRYLNSCDEPTKFPLTDLERDNSYFTFKYEYKDSTTHEAVIDYRRPSDPTDSNVYLYSYHFGWIVLTEKEYNDILRSPERDKIIWDYFQTKEKLVF